jgi:hypothetical protein
MLEIIPIKLLRSATKELVPATLRIGISEFEAKEAERTWRPHRQAHTDALIRANTPADDFPEHSHWNWAYKSQALQFENYLGFSIECERDFQGMMLVRTKGDYSRLPETLGQPLLYVEYVESAPWNLRSAISKPRFKRVGKALLKGAVDYSHTLGYRGRIGLHSLPQSVSYYESEIGMTFLDLDERKQNLGYLEFSEDQANRFSPAKEL